MSSIFNNINDTSNYNSILSQSKALKESKENNQVSFANTLIKENLTKLNELNTKNSQSLIKSEILSNTNPLEDTLQNSIYTLKFKQGQTSSAVSMAYGYGVDANGYMSEDFNKAAGLPEGFKIHKSTLEEIERYNNNSVLKGDTAKYLGASSYFTQIDMAATIKQYYNIFSQALSQTFPDDKTSFSEADINSMPSGYAFSGNSFTNYNARVQRAGDYSERVITNVYQTPEQLKEANELYITSGFVLGIAGDNLGLSLQDLKNAYNGIYNNSRKSGNEWEFNLDMSVYPQNEDGTYSKEALFMSLLNAHNGEVLYSPNNKLNPLVQAYNTQMEKESYWGDDVIKLDDIMTGKIDFASILKSKALEGWLDSNIYAYENGVKWQNSAIGYGGASFDRMFEQAKANGWRASSSSIDDYVGSIMERFKNLINQTRA